MTVLATPNQAKQSFIPLGPNLVIKMETTEVTTNVEMSDGSIKKLIISAESTREAQAREQAIIISLGMNAFDDLEYAATKKGLDKTTVIPKVGDKVVIARYDGHIIYEDKFSQEKSELRLIQDTRILAIVREEG